MNWQFKEKRKKKRVTVKLKSGCECEWNIIEITAITLLIYIFSLLNILLGFFSLWDTYKRIRFEIYFK